MDDTANRAVAIVGIGAVMPDAPDAAAFWNNIKSGRYSISEVPPDRWDPALYYDPDPAAPDKTYSKIGGWVRDFAWEPMRWKLPIPPKVSEQMDEGQHWSIACSRAALLDAGWPDWPVDPERVAVIFGNAHRRREALRDDHAGHVPGVRPRAAQRAELRRAAREHPRVGDRRDAQGLHQPLAGDHRGHHARRAVQRAGRPGLQPVQLPRPELHHRRRLRVRPGRDERGRRRAARPPVRRGAQRRHRPQQRVNGFVKFCKIGALSATGTRPFDAGADGFVMGEGAAVYVLKRLADAERDGDRIYAVLLALGGSSDGKGKGITAPNPVGQRLAVERAWQRYRAGPGRGGHDRGARHVHPRRGPAREPRPCKASSGRPGRPRAPSRWARSSPTSATSRPRPASPGLFKAAMSLHEKVLPPSLNFRDPEPQHRLGALPVRGEHRTARVPGRRVRRPVGGRQRVRLRRDELPRRPGGVRARPPPDRRAALLRGRRTSRRRARAAAPAAARCGRRRPAGVPRRRRWRAAAKAPLRGALVVGAASDADLAGRLRDVVRDRRRPSRRSRRPRRQPPTCARRCASPSTTATPPSSPTRRGGR